MDSHSLSYTRRIVAYFSMYFLAVCQAQPTRLAIVVMMPALPGITSMNCCALYISTPKVHPYVKHAPGSRPMSARRQSISTRASVLMERITLLKLQE